MSPSAMSPSAQVVVELATKVAQAKTASDAISAAYRDLEESFIDRNLKSKAIYDEAIRSMPGGNTRTVLHYPPFPLSMTRAEGCKLYDADGHEYIDLLGKHCQSIQSRVDANINRRRIHSRIIRPFSPNDNVSNLRSIIQWNIIRFSSRR